jgi:hypothetical protein
MRFSGLGKIGMRAPVSYPSIVWDAVAAIFVMPPSGTVNADKGIPSFRHEYAIEFQLGNDNVVDLYE